MDNTSELRTSRASETPQQEIARCLEFFHGDGSVFELCAIGPKAKNHRLWEGFAGGKKGIVAGWFDDHQKALKCASDLDAVGADGIYITLNPCNPALLARAKNRLVANVERTTDHDILSLDWLLIDVDPQRPKGTSSSGTEHKLSLEHALTIKDSLSDRGWPEPLYADSGNGSHLIYRLPNLDNTKENIDKLKAVLASLHALFSVRRDDVLLEVDRSVYNPARICKLYGTRTRKGDNTTERPHRYARILSIPELEPGEQCHETQTC